MEEFFLKRTGLDDQGERKLYNVSERKVDAAPKL
jgi:hypothetical protein